ncbi:oxaloacetate decarboxylase [Carnobacterium viridans]|uniref:Oxaloacetate decarboxylase, gamma chain n=1 Tax=Carnobacterium viridans TaxID=174587 RepID=A0A1H0Y9X4_9LACT|nr:hypothetical protein [Carnobacterium viridans]UDE95253.1 oxaloacetate decarboxylase [Carnobacterium viridans]SDQ11985.1 hypothetical protein SAMN04487752_0806 [Carnobacterium viridans]
MERFSYLDIVVIAVVGLLVLFVLLIVWQLFRQLIQLQSNQHKVNHQTETTDQTNQDFPALVQDEDEETKLIAVLMALILANEDQQDKSYQVTKIERIR